MAYQYSNAAREIASIKTISTRNLLMVLASAVDAKTGTCFHSAGCLMHWSQLSKSTFYLAVAELEKAGILSRKRRRARNRTNEWRLDIKKMESLRVSWDSVKPKDAVPEPQDDPTDDSGMGLPKPAFEIDEEEPLTVSKAFEIDEDVDAEKDGPKSAEELGHFMRNGKMKCDVCDWFRSTIEEKQLTCEECDERSRQAKKSGRGNSRASVSSAFEVEENP